MQRCTMSSCCVCPTARCGNRTVLDFSPTVDFPSLQYFDVVEKNSQADLAGLRSGDFLLQVHYLSSSLSEVVAAL